MHQSTYYCQTCSLYGSKGNHFHKITGHGIDNDAHDLNSCDTKKCLPLCAHDVVC